MEATITTIGDVFKSKVKESLKIPTIWRDLYGDVHEDFKAINISGKIPLSGNMASYVPASTYTRFPGLILQVGSHVKSCYYIGFCGNKELDKKIPNDLFKYATSLEKLDMTFAFKKIRNIPSDLFDSCTQLETIKSAFYHCSELKSIPSDLFSHNRLLKNINDCFSECTELTKVPTGLFDHNSNLCNLTRSFLNCIKLTTIPDGLFNPLSGKQVYLGKCFTFCDIQSIPAGIFKPISPKSEFEYLFGRVRWRKDSLIFTEFSKDKKAFIEKYFPDGIKPEKILGNSGIFEDP